MLRDVDSILQLLQMRAKDLEAALLGPHLLEVLRQLLQDEFVRAQQDVLSVLLVAIVGLSFCVPIPDHACTLLHIGPPLLVVFPVLFVYFDRLEAKRVQGFVEVHDEHGHLGSKTCVPPCRRRR